MAEEHNKNFNGHYNNALGIVDNPFVEEKDETGELFIHGLISNQINYYDIFQHNIIEAEAHETENSSDSGNSSDAGNSSDSGNSSDVEISTERLLILVRGELMAGKKKSPPPHPPHSPENSPSPSPSPGYQINCRCINCNMIAYKSNDITYLSKTKIMCRTCQLIYEFEYEKCSDCNMYFKFSMDDHCYECKERISKEVRKEIIQLMPNLKDPIGIMIDYLTYRKYLPSQLAGCKKKQDRPDLVNYMI